MTSKDKLTTFSYAISIVAVSAAAFAYIEYNENEDFRLMVNNRNSKQYRSCQSAAKDLIKTYDLMDKYVNNTTSAPIMVLASLNTQSQKVLTYYTKIEADDCYKMLSSKTGGNVDNAKDKYQASLKDKFPSIYSASQGLNLLFGN